MHSLIFEYKCDIKKCGEIEQKMIERGSTVNGLPVTSFDKHLPNGWVYVVIEKKEEMNSQFLFCAACYSKYIKEGIVGEVGNDQ